MNALKCVSLAAQRYKCRILEICRVTLLIIVANYFNTSVNNIINFGVLLLIDVFYVFLCHYYCDIILSVSKEAVVKQMLSTILENQRAQYLKATAIRFIVSHYLFKILKGLRSRNEYR